MVDIRNYEMIFEETPLAQLLIDRNYRNVATNEQFCKMTGLSRDRILSMKFTDFRDRNIIKYIKDSGETFD